MNNVSIEIPGNIIKGSFEIKIEDPYIEFTSNMSSGFVDLRMVSFCVFNRTQQDALSLIFFLSDGKTALTFITPNFYNGREIIPFLESFSKAYEHTMKFIKDREAHLQQIAKESAQ